VTSVAGLGTNVVTLFVYAGYGTVSSMTGHGVAFAVLAAPYVLVALWLVLRRRDQVDRRRPAPAKSGT
jgi:hypothetical protein